MSFIFAQQKSISYDKIGDTIEFCRTKLNFVPPKLNFVQQKSDFIWIKFNFIEQNWVLSHTIDLWQMNINFVSQ